MKAKAWINDFQATGILHWNFHCLNQMFATMPQLCMGKYMEKITLAHPKHEGNAFLALMLMSGKGLDCK